MTKSPESPLSLEKSDPNSGSTIPSSLLPTGLPGTPESNGRRPTPQELIATENEVKALWLDGQLPFLTHLDQSSDGSLEQFLCDFFHSDVKPTDWVLGSHRSHLIFQLHGGTDLVEQVKRGRSMFLHGPHFLTSAIVAGVASIAVGIALAIERRGGDERVFVFGGDGQENHGHWQEAVVYSWQKGLRITWVILDNDSSCGVTKKERNGSDRLMHWPNNVVRFSYKLANPHAGTFEKMDLKRMTP